MDRTYPTAAEQRQTRRRFIAGAVTTSVGVLVVGYVGCSTPTSSNPDRHAVSPSLAAAPTASPEPLTRETAIVSTLAGTGRPDTDGGAYVDGGRAVAQFDGPKALAVGRDGIVYVSDSQNQRVRSIRPDGTVTTLAGSGPVHQPGYINGSGTRARFGNLWGIAVDARGRVYVTDYDNNVVRSIAPDGTVRTFAGAPNKDSVDGRGSAAGFNIPEGMAVDATDTLYVSEFGRIRKITSDGTVTTVAGTGKSGVSDGPAATANFWQPAGIAVDHAGVLYIADSGNNRIRKLTPDGVVSTLAGGGAVGLDGGDLVDGPGATARFRDPTGIAVDSRGWLYIADRDNNRIRLLSPDGVVSTLAGGGDTGLSSKGGYVDGAAAEARFHRPTGLALGPDGTLYVADSLNQRIRTIARKPL